MTSSHQVRHRAIVRAALAPVRAAPDNRAEQVSEEVIGSVLEVLERSGAWARCRGEDGYEGWLHTGALLLRNAEEAEAWWDGFGGVPVVALEATLNDAAGGKLVRVPWGARLALVGSEVWLPDGRAGKFAEGAWVGWTELDSRFPQDGGAVVSTARRWLGTPYVWGGRTCWGADCSGYVQAVYRLHGFLLPRDSYQQAEIGEPIEVSLGYASLQPGDLLFFRGRVSERVAHVALSSGGPSILHAAQENGSVAANDLSRDSELERSLAESLVGVRRLFGST